MDKERLRAVVVASDKEKAPLRGRLKREIEQSGNFEVFLSREKISRIRSEIAPKNPDVVLIAASLRTVEEFNELCGFVRKVRRHLPETIIVIHAPKPHVFQLVGAQEAGVNVWLNDREPYELLGQLLLGTLSRRLEYEKGLR